MKRLFVVIAIIAVISSTAQADSPTTSSDRWKTHLTEDLLPFWSDPYAAGTPTGSFAPRLCNDGSQPVAACQGVSGYQAKNPVQTLVGQSRQVFSYAIAFHMTGQEAYLDLAKAGATYQFDTFYDDNTGLFFENHDVNTGDVSGVFDSQKQAYGLLGPSFLYYLTGDLALYDQISTVERSISSTHRIAESGGYKSRPLSSAEANPIAKHLDQLNSYKTLLAAQAPLADRAGIEAEALQTAYYIKDAFYDPSTGAIKPTLSTPNGSATVDFGHSIKSFWFIDQTAQLAGDDALSAFAQDAAKSLLRKAFQEDQGAWITNIDSAGVADESAIWWSFAELNQYAASLAIEDPELREMLGKAQAYWLEHFVDPVDAGIWWAVDIATGVETLERPKHWEWKSGFHSYEHALINYLSAGAIGGETIDLYFERSDIDTQNLAYGFSGDLEVLTISLGEDETSAIQRVGVSNLTYAAAAPVPLPANIALLSGALLTLRRMRRRV